MSIQELEKEAMSLVSLQRKYEGEIRQIREKRYHVEKALIKARKEMS